MTMRIRKPKIPKLSCVRSKSSPRSRGIELKTSGMKYELMNDSITAPTTTPQIDPSPPRMIIASTKIEKPNWKLFAFTDVR